MLKDTFGEEIHFDTANTVERKCPKGQTGDNINAKKTCKHSFELIENEDKTEIKLKRSYSGEKLNADMFCLINYNGTGIFDHTAVICMDSHETAMELFQMIILCHCIWMMELISLKTLQLSKKTFYQIKIRKEYVLCFIRWL